MKKKKKNQGAALELPMEVEKQWSLEYLPDDQLRGIQIDKKARKIQLWVYGGKPARGWWIKAGASDLT